MFLRINLKRVWETIYKLIHAFILSLSHDTKTFGPRTLIFQRVSFSQRTFVIDSKGVKRACISIVEWVEGAHRNKEREEIICKE